MILTQRCNDFLYWRRTSNTLSLTKTHLLNCPSYHNLQSLPTFTQTHQQVSLCSPKPTFTWPSTLPSFINFNMGLTQPSSLISFPSWNFFSVNNTWNIFFGQLRRDTFWSAGSFVTSLTIFKGFQISVFFIKYLGEWVCNGIIIMCINAYSFIWKMMMCHCIIVGIKSIEPIPYRKLFHFV